MARNGPNEWAGQRRSRWRLTVADVWFVVLTVALFAVLGLAVRAVERL
jgi:hypothetical protein